MIKTLGRHLLVELYGCDAKLLADVRAVEEIMVEAARATRAEIVDVVFHAFRPFGVSGAVVISESHLTIHTWPEYKYAAIDVYTCGKKSNPWRAYHHLAKKFRSKHFNAIELKRGIVQVKRGSK